MWVFTKYGFYSIVQDKDNEQRILVRTRVKGDLEKVFPGAEIQEDAGSDYRFRVNVHRENLEPWLAAEAEDIDYVNFKAAVNTVDDRRGQYYGLIWSIMADMQDQFQEEEK